MKSLLFTLFVILSGVVSYTQERLTYGLHLSTGYVINAADRDEFRWLQAEFEPSVPVELGGYASYQPFNRISILIGSAIEYNKLNLMYNDYEKYEKEWDLGNMPVSLSHYKKSEELDNWSLKIPVELRYLLLRKLFVFGGGGLVHGFHASIQNKNTFFLQAGIGALGEKLGWKLFLLEPTQTLKITPSNAFLQERYEDPLFKLRSRSMRFSITYKL